MSKSPSKPSSPLELEMRLVSSGSSYRNSFCFKLIKLWVKATVCLVVLPTSFFICIPLSILVIPPLFISLTWGFCICKILYFVCPFRVLDIMNFLRFCTEVILGSIRNRTSNSSKGGDRNDDEMMMEMISKSLEDKQLARSVVKVDPSEVPCFYESDDHDYDYVTNKKIANKIKIDEDGEVCVYEEGSWKFLAPKPPGLLKMKKDKHSFHEVLSYWRSKEKGEAASDGPRDRRIMQHLAS